MEATVVLGMRSGCSWRQTETVTVWSGVDGLH